MGKYFYYLLLLEQDGKFYDDYIQSVGDEEGAFFLLPNTSGAKSFDNVEAAHQWAQKHQLKPGQYAIHGFYESV